MKIIYKCNTKKLLTQKASSSEALPQRLFQYTIPSIALETVQSLFSPIMGNCNQNVILLFQVNCKFQGMRALFTKITMLDFDKIVI